jgi:uncharacterized spore protein YtfJ
MSEMIDVIQKAVPDQAAADALMKRLFDVTHPSSVFSEPISQGEYRVIMAAEVSVGLGYGYGGGAGAGNEAAEESEAEKGAAPGPVNAGAGGGGGGGGGAMARPVAVISIGPDGVRVEPIVDATKIALAFFTTLGAMFMMRRRMRLAVRQR